MSHGKISVSIKAVGAENTCTKMIEFIKKKKKNYLFSRSVDIIFLSVSKMFNLKLDNFWICFLLCKRNF